MNVPVVFSFTKREIVALHFAAALAGVRDAQPDHPGRSNRALVLDSFRMSDAFLDERNRSFSERPDHEPKP